MTALDQLVFESDAVCVGKFRCAPHDPRFTDSGPIGNHLVVFPRTAVWIRHAGARPFLADPRVATIYNKHQRYTRHVASADGDRCDWFGVTPVIALDIAAEIARATGAGDCEDPARPFTRPFAVVEPAVYYRQRALLHQLERGELDALAAEEHVIALVASVVERADPRATLPRPRASRAAAHTRAAHRALADAARVELVRDIAARQSVAGIARTLGVSPYHLCRVFRAETGTTLHGYRMDVRLRCALELLAERPADVARIALELGFASHSHFTAMMRRRLGVTPSQARLALA